MSCFNCKLPLTDCTCRNRCGECLSWGESNCKCTVMSVNPNYYKSITLGRVGKD